MRRCVCVHAEIDKKFDICMFSMVFTFFSSGSGKVKMSPNLVQIKSLVEEVADPDAPDEIISRAIENPLDPTYERSRHGRRDVGGGRQNGALHNIWNDQ